MSVSFADLEYYLAASLLVFSLIAMGCTLTVRDFVVVAKSPRAIVLVMVVQLLVMPLVAISLAKILRTTPGVAIGMLLVTALPGGAYTNLFTYLGKGNVALSVAATTVCTAACVLTTPFVLKTFGTGHLPADFQIPVATIFAEIGAYLLGPLVIGMLILRTVPQFAPTICRVCIGCSLLLLASIVVGATASGRVTPLSQGWRSMVAVPLLVFAALWLTYGAAFLSRLSMADVFTVAIEVVVRNANLGLLLKASLFPSRQTGEDATSDGVLYAVLVYALISLIIASMEVIVRRKGWGVIYGRNRP